MTFKPIINTTKSIRKPITPDMLPEIVAKSPEDTQEHHTPEPDPDSDIEDTEREPDDAPSESFE